MSQQEAASTPAKAAGSAGAAGAGAAGAAGAVRPVSLEWGGQVRGLPLLLGGQIVVGILLGLALYGLTVLFHGYVPLLGAVIIGGLLGLLARDTVVRGGFDNFIVGALCCTLGGVAAFGAFHTGMYIDFINQLDADVEVSLDGALRVRMRQTVNIPPDATAEELDRYQREFVKQKNEELRNRGSQQTYREWLASELRADALRSEDYQGIGNDTFAGYLLLEMRRGVITRYSSTPGQRVQLKGLPLGPAGTIAYRILEIVVAAGLAMWPLVGLLLVMPRTAASHNRLKHSLTLVYLSPDDPIRLTRQVADGEAAKIDKGMAVEPGNFPAVALAVRTPGESVGVDGLQQAGEPEVVLELSWVAKTQRGDLRHRQLGRWWYPVAVLADIHKRFGPPPPPIKADADSDKPATS